MKSRVVIIDFHLPGIGPSDLEEEMERMELERLINSGDMTALIGWAISQGEHLTSKDGTKEFLQLKDSLRNFKKGRSCTNWALLLFFLKRVRWDKNSKHESVKFCIGSF